MTILWKKQYLQIPQDSSIVQLREQVRTLEYEIIKYRVSNIEVAIQQQRLQVPNPPLIAQQYWGPHVYEYVWYGTSGFPFTGILPGALQHPFGQPPLYGHPHPNWDPMFV